LNTFCRLDRLFVLLETGSTGATRKAAAQQLGQVQRLHPHELPLLLYRVHKCLRSTSWETRVAAGQAVEAILGETVIWDPPGIKTKSEIKEEPEDEDLDLVIKEEEEELSSSPLKILEIKPESDVKPDKAKLSFSSFNVKKLLTSQTTFLMASEAKVFENLDSSSSSHNGIAPIDSSDAAKQRNLINKRLGLDIAEKIGIDTSDIVSNEDLMSVPPSPCLMEAPRTFERSFSAPVPHSNGLYDPHLDETVNLSSREINLAKRRARKQKSREVAAMESQNSESSSSSSCGKRLKREDSLPVDDSSSSSNGDGTFKFYPVSDDTWPLTGWVDILLNDLFSPVWEVRHGAATALREVIRLRGSCGGKKSTMLSAQVSSQYYCATATVHEKNCLMILSFFVFGRWKSVIKNGWKI